jgi:hypothetical protein
VYLEIEKQQSFGRKAERESNLITYCNKSRDFTQQIQVIVSQRRPKT